MRATDFSSRTVASDGAAGDLTVAVETRNGGSQTSLRPDHNPFLEKSAFDKAKRDVYVIRKNFEKSQFERVVCSAHVHLFPFTRTKFYAKTMIIFIFLPCYAAMLLHHFVPELTYATHIRSHRELAHAKRNSSPFDNTYHSVSRINGSVNFLYFDTASFVGTVAKIKNAYEDESEKESFFIF
jgi:hypothetical protein